MKTIESYKPLEKTVSFHQSKAKYRCLFGGYGAGKTTSGIWDDIDDLMAYPGLTIFLGRKYREDVKIDGSIWDTFYRQCPPELIQQTREGGWEVYINGGKIVFGGLYTRQRARLKIPICGKFHIDESSEINEEDLRTLQGRLRQTQDDQGNMIKVPLTGIFTTNPPNNDHWKYKSFVLDKNPDYELFKVSIFDNPYLPEEYVRNLVSEYKDNPSWYKRYILGDFGFIAYGHPVYSGFSENLHVGDMVYNQYLPILRGWDFGWHHPCYDGKTQILTRAGWKYFNEIDDKEAVATLNPQTKEVEYQEILAKIDYKYNGKMHHWDSKGNNYVDIRVTHNHFMTYEDRPQDNIVFKQAYELAAKKRKFNLIRKYKWTGEQKDSILIGETRINFKDYCGFMGIYLSEGSVQSYGKHYNINVWQKNRDMRIEEVLNKMPCKWSWQKDHWSAASKDIYEYLVGFGKCNEKYVPDEIRESDTECISEFIRMYGIGDGSKYRGRVYKITTTSEKMADNLQELYFKLSINTRVKKIIRKENSGHFGKLPIYEVNISGYFKSLRRKDLIIEDVENEQVYCVEVPNHIVYVRRNGVAAWCGNCVTFAQWTEDERFVILDTVMGDKTYLEPFAERIIKLSNERYPGCKFEDFCDAAGTQKNDTAQLTSVQTLQKLGIEPKFMRANVMDGVIKLQRGITRLIGDKPAVMCNRRNKLAVDMLLGGYYFAKAADGQYESEPCKEGYYEHVADTIRYIYQFFYHNAQNERKIKVREASFRSSMSMPSNSMTGMTNHGLKFYH